MLIKFYPIAIECPVGVAFFDRIAEFAYHNKKIVNRSYRWGCSKSISTGNLKSNLFGILAHRAKVDTLPQDI